MRRPFVILLVPVLVAAFAACSSSAKSSESNSTTTAQSSAMPEVTVTAADYGFNIPANIPSGQVKVTLVNKGTAPEGHQLAFVKLGSMSFEAFKAKAAKTDLKGLPADTLFVGGPNGVDPGKSASAIVNLTPGSYAVACFIINAQGKPHAALGMVAETTVQPSAPSSAPVVKSDGTITLTDFAFTFPKPFTGKGTYAVTNIGKQVHELALFRIVPGKTLADVKKYLFAIPPPAGAPPIEAVPGLTGLSKGQSAFLPMDLAPGNYAAFCFYPDIAKNDLPHAVIDNMVTEFQIT